MVIFETSTAERDQNEMLPALLGLYFNPSSINQQNHKLPPNEDLFTYERAISV